MQRFCNRKVTICTYGMTLLDVYACIPPVRCRASAPAGQHIRPCPANHTARKRPTRAETNLGPRRAADTKSAKHFELLTQRETT
jgi:hypothetical protein